MNVNEVTYNWSGKLEKRTKTNYIVIHHAAATKCTAEDIHKWHLANGWCGIGYHYFVRKDGSIYRGRPEDRIGAHAYGVNNQSIGICCEGDFTKEQMPNEQLGSVAALTRELLDKYSLSDSAVLKHSEVKNNATICPGNLFPWEAFMAKVSGKDAESVKPMSVREWQLAAILDGYKFPKYGADGKWGAECASVAKKAICKRYYLFYKNKCLTKIIQHLVGVEEDGKFGKNTEAAVKQYQKLFGLSADGIVGINTWKAMLGVK